MARLLIRHGSLGILDPADVIATARLACLIKCGDDILKPGNSAEGLKADIAEAARYYAHQLGQPPKVPTKSPDLQHELTEKLPELRRRS